MSAKENQALLRRFIEEWNRGDLEALNRVIDETVEFAGVVFAGLRVTLTGINCDRIEGGKFVERWYQTDRLGLMQQLGVIPERERGTDRVELR